jgi:hypothetical protein
VVEAVDDVAQDQAICSPGPRRCRVTSRNRQAFRPLALLFSPAYRLYKYRPSPTSIHHCYQRQRSCMRRATLADGCVLEGDICREGMEGR